MASSAAAAAILVLSAVLFITHAAEQNIITSPQPGQEYVFVQTQSSGARPISRKDKLADPERPFETAHKLPQSLTYALKEAQRRKREARPADAPAPAPAGAIKLDPLKLLEKYKADLKTSTTEAPKTTTVKGTRKTANARGKPDNRRRTKKAAPVTDPTPVLTTGRAAPRAIDDDIPLVAAGSEKQRSRIQIKKGPNGQEYEYEYVYYYYDDDEDEKKPQQKVTNSHDGPVRGKSTPEPTANEVVPSRTSHAKGRQLDTEDPVGDERLPANTRFPPRSRNLATTPTPQPEEEKTTRARGRGRPTTEAAPAAETDSNSEETQGSRGRTRPNVRRPSLDLVDSASFNTHSGTAGSEVPAGGPSFPQDLPSGPVRFLGATPHEKPAEVQVREEEEEGRNAESTPLDGATETGETTTLMSAMDKVALDLYAISQGTQKLSGEDAEPSTEEGATGATDEDTATTFEPTTLVPTTEYTTPSTTTPTTTTTTTTTPAPTTTTTTTTEAPLKRFGNRGRIGNRKTTTTAAPTTESHSETKPKKFGGRFGARPRPGTRTTAEPAAEEEAAAKEESKPSFSKPSGSRPRFGANRTRTRTTAAPSDAAEGKEETHHSSTSSPSFRPRPRLPLGGARGRTRTTAAPAEEKSETSEDSAVASSISSEVSSTTQRPRGRLGVNGGAARPALRPGPRINLARGRPGAATTTTTEAAPASEDPAEKEEEGQETEKAEKEPAEATSTTAQDNNPLNRLRNKNRLTVTPASRPKAAASSPVQVRRINPLLSRRKLGTPEPSTSEAPQEEPATEEVAPEAEAETQAPSSSTTTTTEEPRGLSKLLAGRRRLAARQPGTIN